MGVAPALLIAYLALRLAQHAVELALGRLNRRFSRDPARQQAVGRLLGLQQEDLERATRYAEDRYRLGLVEDWVRVPVGLAFLAGGGLGWVERLSRHLVGPSAGAVGVGLAFFGILALAAAALDLPFELWRTFVVEERHGFNRQTLGGFVADWMKGLAIGALLGGALLAAVVALVDRGGRSWWLAAWAVLSGGSVLIGWVYPTLLAPLFNRFEPLAEGALKQRILDLAHRIGFRTSGLLVMDASRRTAHGNAYFTGLFGARRIVLFDTLLAALGEAEVVAVLAHELGHFKLHHVRRRLLRGVLGTGAALFLISLGLEWPSPYAAFGLAGPSAYGALAVFGLWLSRAGFLLRPVTSGLERAEEFAADAFVLAAQIPARDLAGALLRLRETSRSLPLSHPLYSRVYHSHPPLVERLAALGITGATPAAGL